MSYKILAPMTGSILRIECAEGSSVTEGSVLLIMESMKMEVPVESNADGTIHKIHCNVGDLVDQDQLLIDLL
jgi:acetyl-CoA carboxylase biotin carboxyl carrier protein